MDKGIRRSRIFGTLAGVYFPLIAIVTALLIGAVVIALIGFDPFDAYSNLIEGALGSKAAISETLVKAIPLIFTGLSYAIARRCGIINLGAEGQLYIGALFATLVGTNFQGLPMVLHLPLTLMAGYLGGALLGMLVAVLKIKFGASELITTIMLNYVAINLISYFVTGPIKDIGYSSYPQSREILQSAQLPRILSEGSIRIHWGILVALLAILFYYIFLWKTTKGYELRVVGMNPTAGQYAGMNLKSTTLLSMFLAGGFAGLGGSIEIIGVLFRLIQNFSANYGFDGIAVALLGSNNPVGILLSGILFGALRSGSSRMQMIVGVPTAIVFILQALVILFVVGRKLFDMRTALNIRKAGKKAKQEGGARI